MASIEEVIDRVEEWRGRTIEFEELTSGLTNKNFVVTVDGKRYVVRIPGQGSDIFINRDVELHNTLSVSEVGVGAHVYHAFESDYVIVSEFLSGSTMSADSFRGNSAAIRSNHSQRVRQYFP